MEHLSDIIGQPAAITLLQQVVKRRQPSHAYLFYGADSVGKAATAKAFAKALMCAASKKSGEACGQCESCHKFDSGNHPDFRLVTVLKGDAAEAGEKFRISINQIRQNPTKPRVPPLPLGIDAHYHPIVSEWKVYVIDPADLLTDDAGSALLKLLEEPPPYVVIILITSRPGMVLPTLRSRCWGLSFRPVARWQIEKALLGRGADEPQAKLFAALSEGRIGWALTNMQKPEIDEARRKTIELLSALPNSSPGEALRLAENLREIAKDAAIGEVPEEDEAGEEQAGAPRALEGERFLRSALPPVLDLATCWYRDLMLMLQQSADLITNEDFRPLLEAQAARLSPPQISASILALLETKRYLQRYANPNLATETLILRLMRVGP